jgi:predicted nucleic acid-binding protein
MIVLDAGAMIAYLNSETGGEVIRQRLGVSSVAACAHALNMAEVFYNYSRDADVLTARLALASLLGDGVQTRADMDAALCEDAAQLKADWRRISLADCFGVALARRLGAEFLTTDRHELTALEAAGVARIVFIR